MIICFCAISKALRMTNMERVREKINAIKVSKPINRVCNLNFIQTEKSTSRCKRLHCVLAYKQPLSDLKPQHRYPG